MRSTHPDRRSVALGLVAGAFVAPTLVRAQMHAPAAVQRIEDVPDSVLAASSDVSDRVTVPVTVNGRGPFPFIVDTGSTTTVVSDALAAQLRLPGAGNLLVKAATGPVESSGVRVESLAVGGRRFSDMHMPVLARQNIGGLGILGIDAVSRQKLVMDFRANQMLLTASSRRGEDPMAIVVTAKSKYGQLLLVDAEVEGMPIYVILDTGSQLTIGNLTMREMLERHRAQYEVEVTSVTGGSVTAPIGLLRHVGLGHLGVSDLRVAYSDLYTFDQFDLHDKPAMLLGMDTLRRFARVSVDFPAREVRFSLA